MQIKKSHTLQKMIFISIFAAIIAVLSQTQIPMPSGVPITLQTFAIALCGYVLGAKSGVLSVALYIFLGAVGIPVFAGFQGGFPVLFGLTGGFIFGFLFMVFLCGLSTVLKNKIVKAAIGFSGLILCHFFGVLQYSMLSGNTLISSFLLVSLPYLIKDIISVALAAAIGVTINLRVKRHTKLSDYVF